VEEKFPAGVTQLFEELEKSKFISPDGPLHKHFAYDQLKGLFHNTDLSIAEGYYLLHQQKSNS